MSLAAETDEALKARTDPEARIELVKRGLAFDPPAKRRSIACREKAESNYVRKFER